MVERGVALDVCPISNVMTRSVAGLAQHPLRSMLEAGLLCTLASDDPSMFGSWLTGEYELCRSAFGFDDEAIATLALGGVRASFADPATVADLERGIDAWLVQPAGTTSVRSPR